MIASKIECRKQTSFFSDRLKDFLTRSKGSKGRAVILWISSYIKHQRSSVSNMAISWWFFCSKVLLLDIIGVFQAVNFYYSSGMRTLPRNEEDIGVPTSKTWRKKSSNNGGMNHHEDKGDKTHGPLGKYPWIPLSYLSNLINHYNDHQFFMAKKSSPITAELKSRQGRGTFHRRKRTVCDASRLQTWEIWFPL